MAQFVEPRTIIYPHSTENRGDSIDSFNNRPEDVLNEFQTKLKEYTQETICGRPYVLIQRLKKWMASTRPGSKKSQLILLLRSAYGDDNHLRIEPEKIRDPRAKHCLLLIFSILLYLGHGEYLHRFPRSQIFDSSLPIKDLRQVRNDFHIMHIDDDSFALAFYKLQWRFCPVTFGLGSCPEHLFYQVIPVCRKEPINQKGSTAQLWQIGVPGEFVEEDLANAISSSRYSTDNGLGECYLFALKTFDHKSKQFYKNEKNAFEDLKFNKRMVRYLGAYHHFQVEELSNTEEMMFKDVDEPNNTSALERNYNILLEYGEHDLDEYFAERSPPLFRNEIELFWNDLFEIASCIKNIHNITIRIEGWSREKHGWHADIKPNNILRVQGKFKLADPGFAKIINKNGKDPNVPKEFLFGGTETYGAPERLWTKSGTRSPVPQTIDIWSLGCVFSVAATWVVLGYQYVQTYREIRKNALDEIIKQKGSRNNVERGDFFHDGQKVLDAVQVLDLVDQRMLCGSKERINATELCAHLESILFQSKEQDELHEPISESILQALKAMDEAAPSKVTGSAFLELPGTKTNARKETHLPLLKTTHRIEYLASALSQSSQEGNTAHESNSLLMYAPEDHLGFRHSVSTAGQRSARDSTREPIDLRIASSPSQRIRPAIDSLKSHSNDHYQAQYSFPTSPTLNSRNPEEFQDVFAARIENEKRQRIKGLGRLLGIPKDKLLTEYFGPAGRDIKFLVDNAISMRYHWAKVTVVLDTLAKKARGQDPDGMDVTFTFGEVQVENMTKGLTKAIRDVMHRAEPINQCETDMRRSLGEILETYAEQLEKHNRNPQYLKPRKLTIIVLTDGIWAGMNDKTELEQQIISFCKKVKQATGDIEYRPVSIEFVQFGYDNDATMRLRHLDDDLKVHGVPDIVDTEPADGDVNKMLLGSFVEKFDNQDHYNLDILSPTLAPLQISESSQSPLLPGTGFVPTQQPFMKTRRYSLSSNQSSEAGPSNTERPEHRNSKSRQLR